MTPHETLPSVPAADCVAALVPGPVALAGDVATQMTLWLMAAALRLDDWLHRELPGLAAAHPHLAHWRAAAAAAGPGLAAEAWPSRLTTTERRALAEGRAVLPMARAAAALGLTDMQRLAHALAALAEEDARIGALFVEIQGGGDPYPSVETLARVLCGAEAPLGAGWDLVSALLSAGLLVETRSEGPRARRTLAPVPAAWDLARGAKAPSLPAGQKLRPCRQGPRIENLAYPPEFLARLARLPGLLGADGPRLVLLRHMPGADAEEIAAALARAMGRDLVLAEASAWSGASGRILGAVALLAGALPYLAASPGPGEALKAPDLGGWNGPVFISLGREGGLAPEAAAESVTLHVPFPGPQHRARIWREVFGDRPVSDFEAIRDRFQLPLGHVRRVARSALSVADLDGRRTLNPGDLRLAARALGREQLDGLADLLPGEAGWGSLVVPEETRGLLLELADRCAQRERLPRELAGARAGSDGRGVRALFTGPSGTGKTLAARLLGGAIGTDVYRVDLSAVVDKYVGETEKKMGLLLARAEALGIVLLLDEGDGLMARRTDVRSANDRFANLETNFLLQRLESHDGIAIVTTNLPEGIDPAFQRRMDMVVPFPRPAAEARLSLWRAHLPPRHAVGEDMLLRLSGRVAVTGGQIRNAVRAAQSLALAEHLPLGESQLMAGLDRELQKAGAMAGVLPPARGLSGPAAGGLAAFAAALKGGQP